LPRFKFALAEAREKSLPEMAGFFLGFIKVRLKTQPLPR